MKTINKFGRLFVIALTIALTVSCGNISTKTLVKLETVQLQETEINIPLSTDSSDMNLSLEFMTGDLKISPVAEESLVSGIAMFNAQDLRPLVIDCDGFCYTLRQGDKKFETFQLFPKDVNNLWDLKLANIPMNLNIKAGTYTGEIELGGLSIREISINEIGSDSRLTFSEPNHVEMSVFRYITGGSKIILEGLSNANFSQMEFDSGAGDYTLSFDGDLKRDANVLIESGVSTLTIIVPKTTNAVVIFDGGMTTINNRGWIENENVYSISGNGPTLTINIEMGVGTLNLETE